MNLLSTHSKYGIVLQFSLIVTIKMHQSDLIMYLISSLWPSLYRHGTIDVKTCVNTSNSS